MRRTRGERRRRAPASPLWDHDADVQAAPVDAGAHRLDLFVVAQTDGRLGLEVRAEYGARRRMGPIDPSDREDGIAVPLHGDADDRHPQDR